MDYKDFVLWIREKPDDTYEVEVSASPCDVVPASPVDWTLSKKDLEIELLKLQLEMAQSSGRLRGGDSAFAKVLGGRLFDTFFPDSVRNQYDQSRLLLRNGESLRIRLRVRADSLAGVPWEFLYDARNDHFLCLSELTPVVRTPRVALVSSRAVQAAPINVLGVIGVAEESDLQWNEEVETITRSFDPLKQAGLIRIDWLREPTEKEFLNKLRDEPVRGLSGAGPVCRAAGMRDPRPRVRGDRLHRSLRAGRCRTVRGRAL